MNIHGYQCNIQITLLFISLQVDNDDNPSKKPSHKQQQQQQHQRDATTRKLTLQDVRDREEFLEGTDWVILPALGYSIQQFQNMSDAAFDGGAQGVSDVAGSTGVDDGGRNGSVRNGSAGGGSAGGRNGFAQQRESVYSDSDVFDDDRRKLVT